MRILILGPGVIGATYAWQLSGAGHDVTVFVRKEKAADYQYSGIPIACRDERRKDKPAVQTVFRPAITGDFSAHDGFDLILVCVRSNQLDDALPLLAEKAGAADILFFCNNWWGDERIGRWLEPAQVFYGFSRLVGGWRDGPAVNAVIFEGPGQSTLIGEKDGSTTPRLRIVHDALAAAGLKPEISRDILGWLMAHYVEYLGAVGNILKAGSAERFAASRDLVEDAILATREGLDVCRARGLDVRHSAPANLRLFYMPTVLTVPLGRLQYGLPAIRQFFDETIAHGMAEIAAQYFDVVSEGRRLEVPMPHLEALEPYIRNTARRTQVFARRPVLS